MGLKLSRGESGGEGEGACKSAHGNVVLGEEMAIRDGHKVKARHFHFS